MLLPLALVEKKEGAHLENSHRGVFQLTRWSVPSGGREGKQEQQ